MESGKPDPYASPKLRSSRRSTSGRSSLTPEGKKLRVGTGNQIRGETLWDTGKRTAPSWELRRGKPRDRSEAVGQLRGQSETFMLQAPSLRCWCERQPGTFGWQASTPVTASGTCTSRGAVGTCTELAAATVEVFMLMPLVKPSALGAAGPDREAAGSSGFCFP